MSHAARLARAATLALLVCAGPAPVRAQTPRIAPPPARERVELEIRDETAAPRRPNGSAPPDGGTGAPPTQPGPSPAPAVRPTEPTTSAPPRRDAGDAALAILPLPAGDAARVQLARERHQVALRAHRKKDYPLALQGLQDAYALDPRNPEIVNDLAFLHQLLGNPVDAERYYRETLVLAPDRAIARTNLADLLHQKGAAPERLAEAAQHLQRARELLGNRPRVIVRQARLAAARGLHDEAARYYRELVSLKPPGDPLRLEIGDFYRDFGHDDEAVAWYRQVTEARLAAEAAQRIWQVGVEREARRYGFTKVTGSISARARTLADKARLLRKQGRVDEAERLLGRVLRLAPQFTDARAELGDLLREAGRRDEAELAYLRALAFEQGSAELHARLGRLYLGAPRVRALEAVHFLQRALQLRPDWNELYLDLARAYRGAGDLPRALSYAERSVSQARTPEEARTARALRDQLAPLVQARAAKGGAAPSADPSGEVGPPVVRAMSRARALFGRGEPHAAMAELRRLSAQERGVEVLNLEGRILFATGRLDDAQVALRASLARDEAQGEAHEQLGLLLARRGERDAARGHLARARALGVGAAAFHLAKLDAGEEDRGLLAPLADLPRIARLWALRASLSEFLERTTAGAYLEQARAFHEELGARLLRAALAGGALLVVVAAFAAWLRWRRHGGIDLGTLLERHPEAGPDVQRILSAIRHEVLKHNTLVLTGLAEAIARGERAAEKATHCNRSLFGTATAPGAMARLLAYAEELEQVGRAHGERLNLRRRDPALSALLRGFRLLRRAAPALPRVDALGPRARARLLQRLMAAARLLNVEGYEAVRALLDGLRVLSVDLALVEAIFARTRAEPALAGAAGRVQPLALDADVLPLHVVVPRRAFEDILQNLFRNALQSSLRHAAPDAPLVLGLGVALERDDITGLERAAFLVRDRSPAPLAPEALRGRLVEEGLGLTAALVSRYDGTLDVVTDEPGWSKAVVFKLPHVAREGVS